jgi:16S rRNA (cytosine1402-N4)-methyltransferase
VQRSFRGVKEVLKKNGVNRIDRALLDLGLSSFLLEHSGRGFSFKIDEPLMMTFISEPRKGMLTAEEVVNTWSEETLADVIYGFGGESFSQRIARAIVTRREQKPIRTSGDLAEIIKKAVPIWYRNKRLHPATKTFQAIRMAVNDEVNTLIEGLINVWETLETNGRLAIISFHEVEDRIVKNFFVGKAKEELGKIVTKKPVVPSRDEVRKNPRARSAKLRVIIKTSYI